MDIDFSTLTMHQRYELMASLIVLRPIVLVTTLGVDGVYGVDGAVQDAAANVVQECEFVVQWADEDTAEQTQHAGAPIAFKCTLSETPETDCRQIVIGPVRWMHAREELVDTETWRVRLQNYFPVGRFGASFDVKTRDRYSLAAQGEVRSTQIDEM